MDEESDAGRECAVYANDVIGLLERGRQAAREAADSSARRLRIGAVTTAAFYWLHPAALNFDTLSRFTITLRSQDGTSGFVPAHARFPVTVRRSTSNLVTRVTLTAAGAMLVALPAILGAGSPLQLRIAAAVTGAAILAVVTVVLGSAR